VDMKPGVRPGEHALSNLFCDEFLLYECLEDFPSEELGNING